MVGRTLLRMMWVPMAALLSAAAGILIAFSIGQERLIQAAGGQRGLLDWATALLLDPRQLLGVVHVAGSFASALTIIPAVLLIIVGEVARIRSALYYVAGGGLAIAAVPLLMRTLQSSGTLSIALPVLQILATAGFAAGFVYWLLAGRSA